MQMKVYRLIHKDYKGEVVFGLPFPYNQLDGEKKINYLFSKMKPWKHCIPYYKNSKFAFVSLNALISFLYWNSDLTEQEYNDIENNFYVESFDVSSWSSGLSNFLCTYFDDEIDTFEYPIEKLNLKDLRGYTIKYIKQDPVPKEDIKLVKEQYYQNIKTYYN
jgi:hypothetical protein